MARYSNLPQALKEGALFCCWRYEQRDGKPTKVPYNPITGGKAMPNNEGTFTDFQTALSKANQYDGLGVGIFRGVCALDIDHCVDGDIVSPLAQDIINIMDSYTERSPSGAGIRILFHAQGFQYDKELYYVNNQKLGLEAYVADATNKYVTVTGDVVRQGGLEKRAGQLQVVLDKYMLRPQHIGRDTAVKGESLLLDEAVLAKASAASNGAAFDALWSGDISGYASHSEADMALSSMLAFWCGRDTEQMDRLFRQSGLMRPKWGRPQSGSSYGQITLNNAARSVHVVYAPAIRSTAREDFASEDARLQDMHPHDNPRYGWSDIGNGNLFADYHKSVARYVPERKLWFVYNGKVWRPDVGNLKTMELCKSLADQLMLFALSIEDERSRSAYIDFVRRWQSRKNRETILKDAQSVHSISMDAFDNDPYCFNCTNGTLHLKTMHFKPHDSGDKLTKISRVKYDPAARCERFTSFISEVTSRDADKARFLQKALGYGISGDTRYECLFILYGSSTRNGKGSLMESVLKVLGDYGRTARPETISLKQHANSQNPTEDIARLAGTRFVNISEPSRGLVINAAQVKSMTGNDTINARFLHENSFDFQPQFKIYVNSNFLPVITDMTLFSSGRVIIIPFGRHFAEEEQDKTLKREFAKAINQSAILNWLIDGYKLLEAEGLNQPTAVKTATDSYRHDSDKIALFVEEALLPKPNAEERTAEVYARYQRWCNDNGCYAENMRNFKQALSAIARIERKRPRAGGGETTLLLGYRLATDGGISPL